MPQFIAVTHGAADDAAQHITAPFVAGQHAVGNQKCAGADVIGNHFQAGRVLIAGHAGFAGGGLQQVGKQINFVVAVHMLQHGRNTLQAHASVHAGLGQGVHAATLVAVKLHKYAVPDFDKAVAVFFSTAWRPAPDVLAVVVKYFRARAARAGIAHLPEVVGSVALAFVVANADDSVGRQADFIQPDVVGFFVFGIHGGQELVFGQVQPLRRGEKFPRKQQSIAFEIIAKAEIAQHFKKSVVAGGIAHVFQVIVFATGAHAFLAGGGAVIRALIKTEKHVFKLVHARIGKQQGFVVLRRHQ